MRCACPIDAGCTTRRERLLKSFAAHLCLCSCSHLLRPRSIRLVARERYLGVPAGSYWCVLLALSLNTRSLYDVAKADEMARKIKESRIDDPLALLHPVQSGKEHSQLMAFRCAPLEPMFMAQVTGVAVFTEFSFFWRPSHAATQAKPSAAWAPFTELTNQLLFMLMDDPRKIYRLEKSESLSNFQGAFRTV